MEQTRTRLADGVYLTYQPDKKFKTSLLSAQFVTPIRQETAARQALLVGVLRRGTKRYPDMGKLSAELNRLYGTVIDYTVRKKGESQCVGFVADLIDDAYAPGGERLLEPAAALLGELICDPIQQAGRFLPEYVEGERANLVDGIRSILNDKRDYAELRLLQEMCAEEPYGVFRYGDEASAAAITGEDLWQTYIQTLASARLELFYCGSASRERVQDALGEALTRLPRTKIQPMEPGVPHPARREPRIVTEEMDVTQGKLGMGFAARTDDYPALLMGNIIFGGSSNSKLFLNVREKLSLCYYASSVCHRQKQMITVSSGIEFENYRRAYDEIMAQLTAVQEGRLEDWELEGARSTLLNAYASMGDSQGKREGFWLSQTATGHDETPENLAEQVRSVDLPRIQRAMDTVTLDTVYFLKGKEAAE